MTVKSIKHSKEKRVLIPSHEEAGTEAASPKVKGGKATTGFPVNPVVHRGQDPELFWMHKYGADDRSDRLNVDIRSLYRHEHIAPEKIIQRLYSLKEIPSAQMELAGLFGNGPQLDEIEKVSEYYKHADDWTNRLIQDDSLLVMTSLLEREGMAGKVQMIYIDPPYGVKYGSNWQMRISSPTVKDNDADLSGEPEQIKAYRDTWELGIHSYLSYLRDRLLIARNLLTESGSCFVQISDENLHLVRAVMDEVLGSGNFCALISFNKTSGLGATLLQTTQDFILWYAKDISQVKFRRLFTSKIEQAEDDSHYQKDKDGRVFTLSDLTAQNNNVASCLYEFRFAGQMYRLPRGRQWKTTMEGMQKLVKAGRIVASGNSIRYKRYVDDFPVSPITDNWHDVGGSVQSRSDPKVYVVQTGIAPIQRCLLMTTDPGDLILDPTCGSGTTGFVAEQWGRRWITIDTSRIALNIAKSRLLTATFPYYTLHDEGGGDIRQGFVYEKVQHVALKTFTTDEPVEEVALYDQPKIDKKKLRVSGPFTVETLQNFEPVSPEELDKTVPDTDELENFEERIFEHMKSAGVKNGIRNEQAVFSRVDRLNSGYLHAEGFYNAAKGEKKAYIHIGPKFGTVSRQAVNEAVKECRKRGDADWLIILGFSFESNIENQNVTTSMGSFEVTKVRMHDDLMQDGLLKRDKKAASFVTIGEPDIVPVKKGKAVVVEIRGLDIYDPVSDTVKARDVANLAYWMVDDDYDGSNFVVRQVFFCGGEKDEFAKWQKGLSDLAVTSAKRQAEKTLKIEIDDDAFARLYGHKSHPIEIKKKGQKIAVRVISQFGEECTKILDC